VQRGLTKQHRKAMLSFLDKRQIIILLFYKVTFTNYGHPEHEKQRKLLQLTRSATH
jgi:hypothetical protein